MSCNSCNNVSVGVQNHENMYAGLSRSVEENDMKIEISKQIDRRERCILFYSILFYFILLRFISCPKLPQKHFPS